MGAGHMAGTHARAYDRIPNARVAGVMDIRPEAAQALAAQHGARAYTDFDQMLAELKPDVVDVCTPTPFHEEYVCRAAGAAHKPRGISVEKPMGRTVEQCRKMVAACEAAGVPLFVAQVVRFFPEFAEARAQVELEAVGKPAAVRTRRGGGYPHGWDDWFGRFAWSGGVILDLAIHDLDWLRWTFGPVERVFAKCLSAREGAPPQVDNDYALITLRFESGVVGHVEGTWADPGGFKVAIEIAGDQGLLEYNFNQPTAAPYVASLQAEGDRQAIPTPESPTAANPYQLELEDFLSSLERGVPASVTGQDGLEAVRIAEAAIESARTGQVVRL